MASTSQGAALRTLDTAAANMGQLGKSSPGSHAQLPASNGRGQAHSAKPVSHGAAANQSAAAAAAKLSATAAAVRQPAAAAARPPEAPAEPPNDFARSAIVAELHSFDAMFTTAMKDDSCLTKALRKGPFIRQSWKRVRCWHGASCLTLVALGLTWPQCDHIESPAHSLWHGSFEVLGFSAAVTHVALDTLCFACELLPHGPRHWPAPALGLQLYSARPSICHVIVTVICNAAPAQRSTKHLPS